MAVLTLAEMQESVCQKTYNCPEGIVGVLEQTIKDATQARNHRYALHAPQPGDRLWERMRFYLRKLLRRTLNDLAKAGQAIPSARELRDTVEEFIYGEFGKLVYEQVPGDQRASSRRRDLFLDGHDAVIRLVRDVVAYTKKRWKPAWITRAVAAGRSGGTKSRRGPTWTDEDLDVLAGLSGTVKEQAFLLGRSVSTVNRMRRALKERVVSRNKEDSEAVGADLGPEPVWPGEEAELISGVSGNDMRWELARSGDERDLPLLRSGVRLGGDAGHPRLLRAPTSTSHVTCEIIERAGQQGLFRETRKQEIMSRLIIEFQHTDVHEPAPWPIGINDDNVVTSGLGHDDGAVFLGFARKGQQEYFASPTDIGILDFQAQDIVPVFTNNGTMFNWDIAIRAIRAVDVPNTTDVADPTGTVTS